MKKDSILKYGFMVAFLSLVIVTANTNILYAKTAKEIDASVEAALKRFKTQVKSAEEYLKAAKGVLLMPGVSKAGIGLAWQYGEGALKVNEKVVDYYRLVSGSMGFTLGVEKHDMVLVFMTDAALKKFQESKGWEAGVDGNVTMINVGAAGSIETLKSQHSVVGFALGMKGLMADASVKGAKYTKIKPK